MRYSYFVLLLVLLGLNHYRCWAQQPAPGWSSAEILGPGTGLNNGFSLNYAVATGSRSSLLVGGVLYGRVSFPGLGPLATSNGGFIGRQNAAGQWEWVRPLQGTSRGLTIGVREIKTDAQQNIYLVANILDWNSFIDTLQTGSGLIPGHGFVIKLTPAGQWLWVKGIKWTTATTIEPDGLGGAYVGGNFERSTQLDNIPLIAPQGGVGSFLAHLDSAGTWTSAQLINASGSDGVLKLASDSQGGLLVGGLFWGFDILFGNKQAIGRLAHKNGFVARFLPATNTWQWAASIRGADRFDDLKVDAQGNTYCSGLFFDSIYCGNTRLLTTYPIEATYVGKLDRNGQWRWATRPTGNTYYSDQQELALAPNGDVLLSGTFRGDTARFGTQLLHAAANHHWAFPTGYVTRIQSSTGQFQWALTTPNEAPGAFDMTVDSTGTNLILVGALFPSYGGTTFGTTTLEAPIAPGFVAALALTTRQWQWANGVGTGGGTYGIRTMTDAQGNLTVAGTMFGEVTFGNIRALAPYQGTFIARRAAGGNWQWALASTGFWPGQAMHLAPNGAVYMLGYLDARDDTVRIGSRKPTYRPWYRGGLSYALVKLTPGGQVDWVRPIWMRDGYFSNSSISVDRRGNVTLAGGFKDTLLINGQRWRSTLVPHTARRTFDSFVVRFDAQGNMRWINRTNTIQEDYWSGVVDQAGGATVIGHFSADTVRLGGHQLVMPPGEALVCVMAHLDSLGHFQWLKPITGTEYLNDFRMVTDHQENLWLSSRFSTTGDLNFGNHRISGAGLTAGSFVIRFNAATLEWERPWLASELFGAGQWSWPNDSPPPLVVPDGAGGAYIGAAMRRQMWINNNLLTDSSRHPVGVVLRLDSLGRVLWRVKTKGQYRTEPNITDLAPVGPDALYVTGYYEGGLSFGPFALPAEGMYKGFLATIGQLPNGLPEDLPDHPDAGLALWPNPATATAHLRLPNPAAPGQQVRLYDALGRLVRHYPLPSGTTTADLPLTGVPPGVYIVRSGTLARRLVVAE